MTAETDARAGRPQALALVALAAATLCFSLVPMAVRFSEVGPTATAFWRFLFALAPLLLWLRISRQSGREEGDAPPNSSRLLAVVSLALAADMITWHTAIAHTSVVNSMLIAYSSPILVAIGAWIFLKERFGMQFTLGLILSLLGSYLLISHGSAAFGSFAKGDYLAIAAAAMFSVYVVGLRSVRRHLSTAKVLTWNTIIPTPVLLVAALALGETILPHSLAGWSLLIGYALIVHVLGQGLFTYAIAQLPAAFNVVAILGSPVIAAGLAWALLDEAMTPLQIAYGVVVLIGIYLAHRGSASAGR